MNKYKKSRRYKKVSSFFRKGRVPSNKEIMLQPLEAILEQYDDTVEE